MFSLNEDVLCIYADLDSLIERAGLSEQERLTVDLLMKGYVLSDIAEHYGKSRHNFATSGIRDHNVVKIKSVSSMRTTLL